MGVTVLENRVFKGGGSVLWVVSGGLHCGAQEGVERERWGEVECISVDCLG